MQSTELVSEKELDQIYCGQKSRNIIQIIKSTDLSSRKLSTKVSDSSPSLESISNYLFCKIGEDVTVHSGSS